MGRPPSNGGPAFRFMPNEVVEMEGILQEHHNAMPARELLVSLADKFSESPTRKGKIVVQMKQVWNWFQNRRYAIRAKSSKAPVKLSVTPMVRDDSTPMKSVSQPVAAPSAPASLPAASAPGATRTPSENSYMEFEAKSARDGAWYDVGTFLSHRHLDTGDPEVLVRFAGFGPDEDEWVNVRKHIRQRSLPCEASECIAVLPGDLILCFQEGKDQALYFDAHVLDAQRRRHDVRGCRCRFLVRYDHDQSEEIVPLRKVCRRPETDYRLQQLNVSNDSATADQKKDNVDPSTASTQRTNVSTADTMQKQSNSEFVLVSPVSLPNVSLVAKTTATGAKNAAETSSIGTAGNPIGFPSSVALTGGTAPTTALITASNPIGFPSSVALTGGTAPITASNPIGFPSSVALTGGTAPITASNPIGFPSSVALTGGPAPITALNPIGFPSSVALTSGTAPTTASSPIVFPSSVALTSGGAPTTTSVTMPRD